MNLNFDLFVIGAGIAGLTAANEAATRGLSICLAEEQMFGGLALNVNHLTPGLEGAPASGSDLASELMERASGLGVTMLSDSVASVESGPDGSLLVATASSSHCVRCVIVASGARLRQLGVPGEADFEDRGVSHCADCDAPLYQGQTVVVVGGGDSALQESLVLAGFCSAVHLVQRAGAFTARAAFIEAVSKTPRIETHFNTVVHSLQGDDELAAVQLHDVGTGRTYLLPCRGVFVYVGLEPNASFLPPGVKTDAGGICVNERLESSLANVFAIGAVRSGCGGELIHAVEDARIAVAACCETIGNGRAAPAGERDASRL